MAEMAELMTELGTTVAALQAAKEVARSHVKRLVGIREELHALGIDITIQELGADASGPVVEDAPDGSVTLSRAEIPAPSVTRGPDPDPVSEPEEEFKELSESELAHQRAIRGGTVETRSAVEIRDEATAGVVEDPSQVMQNVSAGFMGAYEAGMAEAAEKARKNQIAPPGWQGFG